MIATSQPSKWTFNSPQKQCVSDYFKKHPDGDYTDFQDNWRRSAQVGRSIFDEVYRRLQHNGAIKMVVGGQAWGMVQREAPKEKPPEPMPPPPVAAVEPSGISIQAPLNYPNAIMDPSTTTEEELNMPAKEYGIKELSSDQRLILDKTLAATPEIEYEDLCTKIGFRLKKPVFYTTKVAIRASRWKFSHLESIARRPSAGMPTRVVSGQVNGHIPLINYTRISSPQVIGSISTEGYNKEEIKFIGTKLPSILAELLDTRLQFRVFRVGAFEGNNEIEKLEFRRIS